MRISPTGTTEPAAWAGRAHGFSLIEILVVVAIVGITTTLVVLSVHGSGEREVENAAQRAKALVRLACERASLSGRDIGFSVVQQGLRFGYFEHTGWQPLGETGSDELRARPLGRDLHLRAEREGMPLPLSETPDREPAFACLSSGELTPFVLHIDRPDAARPWRLEGHLNGELDLQQVPRER